MDYQNNLDSKAQARLEALAAWAEVAASRDMQSRSSPIFRLCQLRKRRHRRSRPADAGALASYNAMATEAGSFWVLRPHLELPDELAAPLISPTQSIKLPDVASLQLKPVVEVTPAEVVATHADPSIGAAAAKEASVTLVAKIKSPAGAKEPKWESDARAQVRLAVRRFAKPLQDLVARDANEGDTRLLITDMLCERLGYDKFRDLTTEYMVKQDYSPVTVSESTSNLSPSSRSNA
ncbi:hypothetical protein [Arthrobacter sp. A5]|uniref:hypothetical protein n=1 Tax=Arthrobacter sp. A5 TaxID=576926 RepID=UPI003DA8C3BA